MSVQHSVHVILEIHVYITYWITLYKLGDGELVPYKRMKMSPKVHQKLVLDLPDHPCGADYVVGGGVQNVIAWVVVHHESVVTGGPQIIGHPIMVGVGPKIWVQHLQVLVASMVPRLPNNPPLWSQQCHA